MLCHEKIMSKSGTINSNHIISNRIAAARKKTSSENIQLTLMTKYLENFEEFALIRIVLKTFKEKREENGQAKTAENNFLPFHYMQHLNSIFFVQAFNITLKAISVLCQGSKIRYTQQ